MIAGNGKIFAKHGEISFTGMDIVMSIVIQSLNSNTNDGNSKDNQWTKDELVEFDSDEDENDRKEDQAIVNNNNENHDDQPTINKGKPPPPLTPYLVRHRVLSN